MTATYIALQWGSIIYVFWLLYLAVMGLYRAKLAGEAY